MLIAGKPCQSLWYEVETDRVCIIDQTCLPHELKIRELASLEQACEAITSMRVRGAPLIGVTAAYGVYLALRQDPDALDQALAELTATRPTAVNLRWALDRCSEELASMPSSQRVTGALQLAQIMEKEDIAICEAIGEQGAAVLASLWEQKQNQQPQLNVLTHCNAGSLATVDWGTALAVIYKASDAGIPVHVWVDETRPRNQGASLTCWELGQNGVEHTLVVDNAGGYLMQQGLVDICLVGSDVTALNGDVCNKIGTYLKALAAQEHSIPFYVALPVSSIDFSAQGGLSSVPIEERDSKEVTHVRGNAEASGEVEIAIAPPGTRVSNYGFDITPASMVTALITERGVVAANAEAIAALQPTAD